MIAEKTGKPSAQRNLLRVLRVLLGFAIDQKLRRDNPALGVKLDPIKTSGFHSWTEDELRQYEQHHPIGSKARLALALLLYTAQRRSDVVRLGPPLMRDGRLIFEQSKTGAAMDIPVAPPLADIIAATPMGEPSRRQASAIGSATDATRPGFRIARPTVFVRRSCGAWPKQIALRTSSPASAATRTIAKSEPMCRPPTRRAWQPRAWQRRLPASRLESEHHDCQL
jgi:integrase